MKPMDLTGERFGRLSVVGRCETRSGKHILWECFCECGSSCTVITASLRSGNTKSCGCWQADSKIGRRSTHNKSHTRTWESWSSMKKRCLNPNDVNYHRYGGRGIGICERWLESFENFIEDMGDRPKGMSIERIDNDGNYELGNCKWAAGKEQARNRRTTRLLNFRGETRCLTEWGEITGLNPRSIRNRLDALGWDVERALTTPARKWGRQI